MIKFDVNIFNYLEGTSATYTICGYIYSETSSWFHPTAYSIGGVDTEDRSTSKTRTNLSVRFGHDGTKCCVYIGASTSEWKLPIISISNITYGYGTNDTYSNWGSGWNIGFTTTLGTITKTIQNTAINDKINVRTYVEDLNYPIAFVSGPGWGELEDKYGTFRTLYADNYDVFSYNPKSNLLRVPRLSLSSASSW